MADFKEQTNSLMVRVIPIYLAAELLCPDLFKGGSMRAGGEEAGRICHVKQREECAARVYLIAA